MMLAPIKNLKIFTASVALLAIGFAAGALWQRHRGSNYEQEIAYHMRQMQRHADAMKRISECMPRPIANRGREPWDE
jgi:hypothetical protein